MRMSAFLKLYCVLFILLLLTGIITRVVPKSDAPLSIDESERENAQSSYFLLDIIQNLNSVNIQSNTQYEQKYQDALTINSDVIGWISSPELNIDYPVLYSTDNKEYLRKDIYGNYDLAGSIYLDSNYNNPNVPLRLIHGHNMKNGKYFSNVPGLLNKSTLDSAPLINFYTEGGLRQYKIFSVFSVDSTKESFIPEPFLTLSDLENLKETYLNRSWVPISTVPPGIDLLLLNTCWYGESGNERNLHCIVVACLI